MNNPTCFFSKAKVNKKVVASAVMILFGVSLASATSLELTITNNGPDGGVFITPIWVGFHNGSFDSYDGGAPTAPELERLAEDGNTAPISDAFDTNGTLVPTGVAQTGTRQQGTVGGGPVGPGASVSQTFDVDLADANRFFSYASMVIPSNDYFIANGSPVAHDLSSLDGAPAGSMISFDIGLANFINDAGTELNFENLGAGMVDESVAGLGLLGPGFVGQSLPDTGTPEGGVIGNVLGDPFTSDLLSGFPGLNFNDSSLYPNGIASVKLTVLADPANPIPEPSTIALTILGLGTIVAVKRRKDKQSISTKA